MRVRPRAWKGPGACADMLLEKGPGAYVDMGILFNSIMFTRICNPAWSYVCIMWVVPTGPRWVVPTGRSSLGLTQVLAAMLAAFNGPAYEDFFSQIDAQSKAEGKKWWGYVAVRGQGGRFGS